MQTSREKMSDKEYICRFCRKPLQIDFANPTLAKMWELFDMPKDGGAHLECLAKPTAPPKQEKQ